MIQLIEDFIPVSLGSNIPLCKIDKSIETLSHLLFIEFIYILLLSFYIDVMLPAPLEKV